MLVSPKRMLWPTDFSPLSFHGARYARGLRDIFQSELHVIHVLPPPLTPDLAVTLVPEVPVVYSDQELVQACRQRMAELISEQFGQAAGVVSEILFGNPWPTICQYARDKAIDLVIIATHGRTRLRHVLIGSTAERIVQHAPCPVLVVKNPEQDFVTE